MRRIEKETAQAQKVNELSNEMESYESWIDSKSKVTEIKEVSAFEALGGALVPTKKEQKISESYTIKAFAKHITNMKKAKMITEEEYKKLKDLHITIMNRWIGGNMFEE